MVRLDAGRGAVREIPVEPRPLSRFQSLIGRQRYRELRAAAADARSQLAGTTVWNVNSTGTGGGVAEMLQVLVGYIKDAGIDARWLVIKGDPGFFAITKRLHNRLHGFAGDDGELGPKEAALYEAATARYAMQLLARLRPGDVVVLHDPQPAGLVAPLTAAGIITIWRSHIGTEQRNRHTDEAWDFLRPYVEPSAALVFSRKEYIPEWAATEKVQVIPPSIDAFAPKNEPIPREHVTRILREVGILAPTRSIARLQTDDPAWHINGRASLVGGAPPLEVRQPLVVQVSRWDRLKDMRGVMEGFASEVSQKSGAQLALVGPAPEGVADDPEAMAVLADCAKAWHRLPASAQSRIRLVTLPMSDLRENAIMVNAVQRHARVVVQKSLAEGFGLTVAEAMWKAKPVIASAVGGIVDQLGSDSGVLLDDPSDLDEFGMALSSLLSQPATMRTLGRRARRRVLDNYLGDRHLIDYAHLIRRLLA